MLTGRSLSAHRKVIECAPFVMLHWSFSDDDEEEESDEEEEESEEEEVAGKRKKGGDAGAVAKKQKVDTSASEGMTEHVEMVFRRMYFLNAFCMKRKMLEL